MLLEFALGWVINHELEVIIVILGEKTDNSTYWKRFNGPDNFTVLWNPFDTSNSGFKLWWVCIIWNWNVNLHIVGRWSTLKLTFCLQKSEKNHISKHEHYACKFRELPDNFPLPQSAERQHNTNVQINFSKEKSPRETGGGCVRRCCWWSTENNQKRRQTSHNYFRTSDLNHVLDAAVGMFFNHGLNPDQWLHLMGRYFTAVDFTLPWSQSCHFLIKLHWIHKFHKQELTHKQKAAKTGRH